MADRGRGTFAVSGGQTPWRMLRALAGEEIPWGSLHLFQVDERVAPPGHADRNLVHIRDSLGSSAIDPSHLHAMPVEDADLPAGDPVLHVSDVDVAITGAYQGRRRMTLTYPALNRARMVLWVVTGADKASVLPRLVSGDGSIPAGRIRSDRALLLADALAAAGLASR